MITKAQLRTDIEAKRNALEVQWIEDTSAHIVKNMLLMESFQTSKMVALYKSIPGEVTLAPLFFSCWQLGKRTCIPVFNSETKRYAMAEITEKTQFKTGHYGIPEPASPCLILKETIDLIVLPGVAFDFQGNRLGRGGGYYDRILDGFPGRTISVAFDFQVFQHIPTETHDKPIDFIVTETKIVEV